MNYYLARDGQTYGPYPEESFPAMLAAGQVVPEDLVCTDGGDQWVAVSTVPSLCPNSPEPPPPPPAEPEPAATPSAYAPRKLRISASATAVPPVVADTSTPHRPALAPRRSLGETAGSLWDTAKTIIYALIAIGFLSSLVLGYIASQHQRREIEKLQTQPGWDGFDSANKQIESETSEAGNGNTGEAAQLAKLLTKLLTVAEKECFVMEKGSSYHGRSKLGRVISAADAATAGTGHFQTFIELRGDRVLALIHVPEYRRYENEARNAMRQICWELACATVSEKGKLKSDRPLIVGVRGSSAYDCVFEGSTSATPDRPAPRPVTGNVASHKVLVKWFGAAKP